MTPRLMELPLFTNNLRVSPMASKSSGWGARTSRRKLPDNERPGIACGPVPEKIVLRSMCNISNPNVLQNNRWRRPHLKPSHQSRATDAANQPWKHRSESRCRAIAKLLKLTIFHSEKSGSARELSGGALPLRRITIALSPPGVLRKTAMRWSFRALISSLHFQK